MDTKKTLIISIVGVIAFILAIIGASYAFFTASVEVVDPNENRTGTSISSAKLSVKYIGTNEIDFDKMIPGDTFTKTFTLENTGTVDISYKIVINEVSNNFISKNDLKVELFEGSSTTPFKTTVFPSATTPLSDELIIKPSDGVKTFRVVITYLNTASDQSPDMNHSISGKICIEEVIK